jgi:hypothetical protein
MGVQFNRILSAAIFSSVCAANAWATPVTTGTADISAQNIVAPAEGATTASNYSVGSYVVESFGSNSAQPNAVVRPIFMFDAAAFAGLDPTALTSASLSFILTGSWLESGDTYATQVRLFSTPSLIPLTSFAAASQYAALTGDGGPNTTIATVSFGSTPGLRTVTFDVAALAALSTILSSGAGYIGLTIREAAYVENGASSTGNGAPVNGLDGLRIDSSNVSLTIDGAAAQVVPVPAALPLFASVLAGAGFARLRRKRA